ncbi:MAG TPA: chemotaxis protein CheB, partial [Planctomycetaceae bacterium]
MMAAKKKHKPRAPDPKSNGPKPGGAKSNRPKSDQAKPGQPPSKNTGSKSTRVSRQAGTIAPAAHADALGADPVAPSSDGRHFPVVGIGASAGGLEALKKLFGEMPASSGMAFVVVPHLDPTHESLMVGLLGKFSTMPVTEAADGVSIEPNHVYVIPPNKYLGLQRGVMRLTGPVERHGVPTSIDFFLRALAADQQEHAIGIILSGTSTHGTLGIKEIKAHGGMAMVQDPGTAEYDQMPKSAIASGLVDFTLPVEKMPAALLEYIRQPYIFSHAG